MEAAGLMTDAGRRTVDVAKRNGWWTISAAKPDTRERRIGTIVSRAARGERAQG